MTPNFPFWQVTLNAFDGVTFDKISPWESDQVGRGLTYERTGELASDEDFFAPTEWAHNLLGRLTKTINFFENKDWKREIAVPQIPQMNITKDISL